MRSSVIIAVVGGILFAVGLIGTVVASSRVNNMDPDYLIDCVIGTPAPDCDARRAALEGGRSLVLVLEILFLVGLVVVVAGFAMDVRWKRRSAKPPQG